MMQVGDSFRINYGKGNVNNRLLHIRGIVDDKVICRRWNVGRGWRYEMLDVMTFEYNKDHIQWLSPRRPKLKQTRTG